MLARSTLCLYNYNAWWEILGDINFHEKSDKAPELIFVVFNLVAKTRLGPVYKYMVLRQ